MRRRGLGASAALAAGLIALAGCSASPDEARERAEEAFDGLVAAASAYGADVLRTVEAAEPDERACGEDQDRAMLALTATATSPVTAEEPRLREVADELVAGLDPEAWAAITPASGLDQRALQDEHGTVVTVTVADPVLVIAVFTPCLSG